LKANFSASDTIANNKPITTRKLTGIHEKTYAKKVLDKLLTNLIAAGQTAEINNLPTGVLVEAISRQDSVPILRDVLS
jgi:hypothetical protein